VREGPETFILTLTNPSGATIGARASTTVTIREPGPFVSPKVMFSVASYPAVRETAGSVTFTVVRVGSPMDFTVDYATGGGTATPGQDYQPKSGTLSFTTFGPNSQTVSVTLLDDHKAEFDETIGLVLSNPSGLARLGTPSTAVLNLSDDDDPGIVSVLSGQSFEEPANGRKLVPVQLRRTGHSPLAEVRVGYKTEDENTTANSDYTAVDATLTFPAGETTEQTSSFNLEILSDDEECEQLESLRAQLTSLHDPDERPAKVEGSILQITDPAETYSGSLTALGSLVGPNPFGTCTWSMSFTGSIDLSLACAGGSGSLGAVSGTLTGSGGTASDPNRFTCLNSSHPLPVNIPLSFDGNTFQGSVSGAKNSATVNGTVTGDTATGTFTFTFLPPATGGVSGPFTATKAEGLAAAAASSVQGLIDFADAPGELGPDGKPAFRIPVGGGDPRR
jgi:hypothetical protein